MSEVFLLRMRLPIFIGLFYKYDYLYTRSIKKASEKQEKSDNEIGNIDGRNISCSSYIPGIPASQ